MKDCVKIFSQSLDMLSGSLKARLKSPFHKGGFRGIIRKFLIIPPGLPLEKGGNEAEYLNPAITSTSSQTLGSPNHSSPPEISIILPVLNEAPILAAALANLPRSPDVEVILVDGGSLDATQAVAARFPDVHLIKAPRGRGVQMNAGARLARGEILLFLHSDTRLTPAHLTALRLAAQNPEVKAGAFYLHLMPPTPFLRFAAWGANWRCRLLRLPYGDQAIFVRRALFFALGGFAHRRPEDLDLVIRLRRLTRLRLLTPPVTTSGRRWLQHGNLRTTGCHWLYLVRHLAERLCTRRWPAKGELWGGGGG